MPRVALTLAAVVALLASCGGPDDLVAGGTAVDLTVTVDPGDGAEREATLSCGGDGPDGTGWLAERIAAVTACDAVDAHEDRLLDGPDEGAVCTQVYGGPQTASVTGSINGSSVDTRFRRTNGCEIADWDRLEALLGSPGAGDRSLGSG